LGKSAAVTGVLPEVWEIVPKIPTKFFLYNYIISKKIFTFAVSNIFKGEMARQLVAGIFYACTTIRGFGTPVWCVNASTALEGVRRRERLKPFFIFSQLKFS
jgi:hypothetical protein